MNRTSSDRDEESSSIRPRVGKQEASSSKRETGAVESLHRTIGNQAVQRLHKTGELQAKLEVSKPGDAAEREAERISELVTRMSSTGLEADSGSKKEIRRDASPSGPPLPAESSHQIESIINGGRPLSPPVRSYFEPRFGRDFSDVRLHNGPKADEVARSINAEAFTLGTDVVFRSGAYDPSSGQGSKLLAHELTHVIQQDAGKQHSLGSDNRAPGGSRDRPAVGVDRRMKPIQRQQSKKKSIEEEKFGGTFSDPIEKDIQVTERSIDEWANILRERGNHWRPTVKFQAFLAASIGHDTFFQSDYYMTRETQREVLSAIGKPGVTARANLMAALLTTPNVELRGGRGYGAMTAYLLTPFIEENFKVGMDRIQESDQHNIIPSRIQNLLGEMSWAASDLRRLYSVEDIGMGEYVKSEMAEVGAPGENPYKKQRPEHSLANQAIGGAIGTAAVAFSQHIRRGERIQSRPASQRVSKPVGEAGPTETRRTGEQVGPKTAAERSKRSEPLESGTIDNQYITEIEDHARVLAGVAKRAEAIKERQQAIASAAIDVAAAGIGAAIAGPAGAAVSTQVAKAVTVAAVKNGATNWAQSGGGGAAPTKQKYKRRFKKAVDEEIKTYKSDPRIIWEGSGNTRTAVTGPFDNAMDESFK